MRPIHLSVIAPDTNDVAEVERHQILADFQRALIGLPSLGEEIGEGRGRHPLACEKYEMRVRGEFRLRASEDYAGLARRRVVRHDPPDEGFRHQFGPRDRHLVDQEIRSSTVLDDVTPR